MNKIFFFIFSLKIIGFLKECLRMITIKSSKVPDLEYCDSSKVNISLYQHRSSFYSFIGFPGRTGIKDHMIKQNVLF